MKHCSKKIAFTIVFFTFISAVSFAEKSISTNNEKDLFEYNNIIVSLEKPAAPIVTDNYIIFTASSKARFTGIAFDFEDYKKIHPFQIRKTTDAENKETNSVMFFLLERPKKISTIKYRLVIDGLWTTDPQNPLTEYESSSGISLSKIEIKETLPEVTSKKEKDFVKFVYRGKSGQKIRLGGTFTNWDSWIYELEESEPGFYQLSIPLTTGTYYYNYYLGMNAIVDKTNPQRAFTKDGRISSVIVVQ